jgi:hypothetical protein
MGMMKWLSRCDACEILVNHWRPAMNMVRGYLAVMPFVEHCAAW